MNQHNGAATPTLKVVLFILGGLAGAAKASLFASEVATGIDYVATQLGALLTIGTCVGLIGGIAVHCRDQVIANLSHVAYELHGYGDQRAAHAAEVAERDTMRTIGAALGPQSASMGGARFGRMNGRAHMTSVD